VNEYGGGAFAVAHGKLVFTDLKSLRVFMVETASTTGDPRAITLVQPQLRYASFHVNPTGVFAVSEDHTEENPAKVVNNVVYLDFEHDSPRNVVTGADFYSTPCLNTSGTTLAWVEWCHPNMSWDGTELYIADWNRQSKTLTNKRKVKGIPGEESCLQPSWIDDNRLVFVSDESGFYQLYLYDLTTSEVKPVLAKATESEFGITEWIFNQPTYAFITRQGKEKIIAIETRAAVDGLVEIDIESGSLERIESPYISIASIRACGPNRVSFFGVSEVEYKALVEYDLKDGNFKVTQKSSESSLDPAYCSKALAIEFPTDQDRKGHALLYLPKSKDFQLDAEHGEKSPLIVSAHGGPTSHARPGLSSKIAYWTSRGYAWLDVNYGGSSGYGKEYRNRLNGQMGLVDVGDTLNAAHYLQNEGADKYHIDGTRIAITGSSAGGYVVLSALTAERQGIFRAGTSYYGISSLLGLLEDTHKFESRYLDKLVGSRGQTKEEQKVYLDRSPLTHASRLRAPLLLLQGEEDKVVPPNQAEEMIRKVNGRTRIDYHLFPGEGHGFRGQETIEKAISLETSFYQEVMDL